MLEIKNISNNQEQYKALYYNNVQVPNSSLLSKTITDEEAFEQWATEEIDLIVKATILYTTKKPEQLSNSIEMDLWIALDLIAKNTAWKTKLKEMTLSSSIYPASWMIQTVTDLTSFIRTINDSSFLYSYLAAKNKNTFINNMGKPNKLVISKGVVTEIKTKNSDTLSWTTSFITQNSESITGIRETYQLQKINNTWKKRYFKIVEDVNMHIERELLPLRHKSTMDDQAIDKIIDKLSQINIPIEIIMINELPAALNNNTLSKKLIEKGLNITWNQIELQLMLLKEQKLENTEIIKRLQLSTSNNLFPTHPEIELPFF